MHVVFLSKERINSLIINKLRYKIGFATRLLIASFFAYFFIITPALNPTNAAESNSDEVVQDTQLAPMTEMKIETQEEPIAFTTKTVFSKTRAKGVEVVTNQGKIGKRVITYEVTFTDGVETSRNQIKTEVTVHPISRVVVKGTVPSIDPNASKPAPPVVSTGRRKIPHVNFDQSVRLVTPQPKPQPPQRTLEVVNTNKPLY